MIKTIIAQPGTTLFHISAEYLGDATEWSRLALINGISDPFSIDFRSIIIPYIEKKN